MNFVERSRLFQTVIFTKSSWDVPVQYFVHTGYPKNVITFCHFLAINSIDFPKRNA